MHNQTAFMFKRSFKEFNAATGSDEASMNVK
jgi:hypothetical protein